MAEFDAPNEESVYEYDEAFEFEAPRWCDLNAAFDYKVDKR